MKRMLASLLGTAIALGSGLALAAEADLQALEQAARKEGQVNSVGMPDSWANWKDTWKDLESKYGLKHMDTDMSSAQELAKFKAEKDNASADIGDVGAAFGPIAVQQGVSQPYKPSTWEQIPAWAKDQDGHWALAYTGTIAFIVNKQLVKDVPHSWADLLQGKYKVTIGDVSAAAQAVNGVLAAAIANGGDEKNIKPGLEFFGKIAKQGRLSLTNPVIATLEKGEVEVGIVWDFNGLSYRQQIDPERFEVLIPGRLGDLRLHHHHQQVRQAPERRQARPRVHLQRRRTDQPGQGQRATDPRREPDPAGRREGPTATQRAVRQGPADQGRQGLGGNLRACRGSGRKR